MAKKKNGMYYSPDGWFLNFLFLAVIIAGLFAATVLVQRRTRYVNKAAELSPQVKIMPQENDMEDGMMIYP